MKAGVYADRKPAWIRALISTSPGQEDETGEGFRVSETGGAVLDDIESMVGAFADAVGEGEKRRTPMTENEHQARYRTKNGSLGSIQGMTVGPSCPSLTPCLRLGTVFDGHVSGLFDGLPVCTSRAL